MTGTPGIIGKTPVRKLLLISATNLLFNPDLLVNFFNENKVKKILFIPYALIEYSGLVNTVRAVLSKYGFTIESISDTLDPVAAINKAELILIGGGNTFLLLKSLYEENLIHPIRRRVLFGGVPFVGCSAGANIATLSINTTNDMPIVYPPTLAGLGLVPFHINPHYSQDVIRDQRLREYVDISDKPVVGLKEGSSLLIEGDKVKLLGLHSVIIFKRNFPTVELDRGSDLSFLLNGMGLSVPEDMGKVLRVLPDTTQEMMEENELLDRGENGEIANSSEFIDFNGKSEVLCDL